MSHPRLRAAIALGAVLARTVARAGAVAVTPFALSFLVTNRCSLSCAHCFYHRELGRRDVRELGLDEYERLARSLGEFGVGLFCGGEPFQRADLARIVGVFRQHCRMPIAAVCTNGQPTASIVRQTAAMLRDAGRGLVVVSVSLDGFGETHDRIRGTGTFARAVRSFRALRAMAAGDHRLLLAVTTVVNTLNQAQAADFVRWVGAALRPDATHVLLARQSPRGGRSLTRVDPAAYAAAQQAALEALEGPAGIGRLSPSWRAADAVRRSVTHTLATGERGFQCHAGRHGAWVDYKGDVHACEVLDEEDPATRIGNLREVDMDFAALWRSARADAARALVNRHRACQACTHETVGLLPSLPFRPNGPL